jgi:predicted SAM-dependent methyltransferase
MIYHAKSHRIISVDISPSTWGYHQNHDYSLRGKEEGITYEKDPEAVYNLSLLPEGKSWGEWTLAGCKMEWIAGVMKEKPPLNVLTLPKKRAGERRRKSGVPRRRAGKRSKWAFLMRPFRRVKRYLFGGDGPGNAPRNDKSPRADSAEVVRAELIKVARLGGPLNLVIGAATTQYDDWISTDINSLNLLVEEDWSAILGELRLDRILAEHVWEHLSPADGIAGLKNVAAYLKPGGRVRIAVPDGHFPDSEYLAYVKPGGHGPGADDHKILYTVETLAAAMREAGLIPVPLENFDAKGEFCSRDWDPADGKVIRSVRFDSRNQGGILKYTSLIMDGMKPE